MVAKAWQELSTDPLTPYRIAACRSPWPLPTWQEPLAQTHRIEPYLLPYTAISTDGSQIYPDRHQGSSCGLINVGTVIIPYRMPHMPVQLMNEPYLILPQSTESSGMTSVEYINSLRQGYEFEHALACAPCIEGPKLVLFDGSLIFWHLETASQAQRLVTEYCTTLMQLYEQRIACIWYISRPKAKDLMNLVRLHISGYQPHNTESYAALDMCVDMIIADNLLTVGNRMIFFKSSSPVTALYPPELQPYFTYIKHAGEVGRLELPAWMVADTTTCASALAMVYDQIEKGVGYPIALAEAHEQAVVKGADRELFYHLMHEKARKQNRIQSASYKQMRKNRAVL